MKYFPKAFDLFVYGILCGNLSIFILLKENWRNAEVVIAFDIPLPKKKLKLGERKKTLKVIQLPHVWRGKRNC